jgi:hypothetical protein
VRVVSSGTWATVHGAASIVAVRSGILGLPTEAEVVGKVIGVVIRLKEPWSSLLAEFQAEHAGSKRRAP